MTGLLAGLLGRAAPSMIEPAPVVAPQAATDAEPVVITASRPNFLLAARLRSAAKLNAPSGRTRKKVVRRQGKTRTARPVEAAGSPVKQRAKETRHVWLRTRHVSPSVAHTTSNVVKLRPNARPKPSAQPLRRAA